ncbi:MAG: FecR domain-containing protein [Gammaproteobacteria bacterium]
MTLEEMIDEAVSAKATEWWSLQRDGQLPERARSEFLSWLRESPRHVEAYLTVTAASNGLARACRAWSESEAVLLEKAAADRGAEVVHINRAVEPSKLASGRRWSGLRMSLVSVASLAVVSFCLAWLLRDELFDRPQTFRAAHAEQSSWRLRDGSVLHLNSDSVATVRYSSSERLIVVERGQAMFQVVKDAKRRFRVDAGDAQVIAVGTEFDIDRHLGATRVTVLSGQVAVIPGVAAPSTQLPTLSLPHATPVKAGEQLDVGDSDAAPRAIDVSRVRAWTQRQIIFDDTALSAVVDEFNRYAQVPVEIADESLKALPISGVLSAYDIDSFVAFLRQLDGVGVERTATRIRIVAAPGQSLPPSSSGGAGPGPKKGPAAAR